jgi:hypothetical protein
MTPQMLESAIQSKEAQLQVTRSSLQLIDFSAQPNGETLRKTYIAAAVALGKELMQLQRRRVPSELTTIEALSVNTSLTKSQTKAMELSQTEDSQKMPMSPPPQLSQGSFLASETPPGLKSVNKWLFKEDYLFSSDRSALEALSLRANLPISYDSSESEPDEEVPFTLLATLDPHTTDEVQSIAHGLRHADALVIESRTKAEMMESDDFIAKITRTKSYLHPTTGLKDDYPTMHLVAEFDSVLKKFQRDGTNVVKRYVGMEYLHFRKKLIPLVLKGLFRLSKRMVASRRPQYQVNMILDVASLQPRTEDIPESDDALAGYALLLLLASPSSIVIAKYAGLDDTAGQQILFDFALEAIQACPVPNTADVARAPDTTAEARSAQKNSTLKTTTPVSDTPSTHQNHRHTTDGNKPVDGDSTKPRDTSFQYTLPPPASPVSPGEVLPPTVLIGQRFFPLPSPRGWDIAREIALKLEPIANHITMGQRIALARRMTKSRCLVAAKELNIKRDIFAATNSVNDIISKSAVNSSRVLAILTTWRRTFFEQLTKRLDRQLERRMVRNHPPEHKSSTTPATSTPATPASAATTSTTDGNDLITIDDSASEASPAKKRRHNPPTKPSALKAKKALDGASTAGPPSNPSKQHRERARKSLSFQKKAPPVAQLHSSNASEEGTIQPPPRRHRQQQQRNKKRKGQPQQNHRNQRRGHTKHDGQQGP